MGRVRVGLEVGAEHLVEDLRPVNGMGDCSTQFLVLELARSVIDGQEVNAAIRISQDGNILEGFEGLDSRGGQIQEQVQSARVEIAGRIVRLEAANLSNV